jgi:UDP-2-acetamido-2,6-beta-L-arabino-hexul-4-ose reductase
MIKKVGITGQSGFIGTHLANYLRIEKDIIEIIPFQDEYFKNEEQLKNFVYKCDAIIHLAAMNRTKGEPDEIYSCNIGLVKQLIDILKKNDLKPDIIFSSSTQEEKDNIYGKSKKDGRKLFEEWGQSNNARITSLIIPNVFGPFGQPYYNSVISTFGFQLTHNVVPKIEIDAELNLIYISDLVKYFFNAILGKYSGNILKIETEIKFKVSELLEKLMTYKNSYLEMNIIPELNSDFEINLFNTFRSYLDYDYFPVRFPVHSDNRGYLFENIKSLTGGQVFFSVTKPGITRGNHFHTKKIERFCVLKGLAKITLRKIGTSKKIEYTVSGDEPAFIDIPIFHTHNITNIDDGELLTLFWSNEIFNPESPDTYFEEV